MPTPANAAAIDPFLRKVRQGLASLPTAEREEIVAELRADLLERQARGDADPLRGFGSPEKLAAEFVGEYTLRGALAQGTSWALGRALCVAGRDSGRALLALLPLLLLQLTALSLLLSAALKPFLRDHVGLWMGGGVFFIGVSAERGATHEVLGWWSLPIFALAGGLLFWWSNRAMMALVRWRLRAGRRTAD